MIVRAQRPQRDFTVIDNAVLRDSRLSLRARGLLALMLSYPDDWRFDRDWIARQTTEGEKAVRAALRDLRDAGYLVRVTHRGDDGTFRIETTLFDTPQPLAGNRPPVTTCDDATNPQVAPLAGNRPAVKRPPIEGLSRRTVTKRARERQRLLTADEWDAIADDHCSDWPGYRSNTEAAS